MGVLNIVAKGIDDTRDCHPLRIAVMTISDTLSERSDTSGGLLVERLIVGGHSLVGKAIVPDDVEAIRVQTRSWAIEETVDVIPTTGGTGFALCDLRPEAIRPMFRREMDGFSVLLHQTSLGTVGLGLNSLIRAGQPVSSLFACRADSTASGHLRMIPPPLSESGKKGDG